MIVTLDTNILASGVVTYGRNTPPANILHAWRNGQFQLAMSDHILQELRNTLEKPYFQRYITANQIEKILQLYNEEAIVIPIVKTCKGVTTTPEDDLTLATALNSKSNYLVTGDRPFLKKVGPSYEGIIIISASNFIQQCNRGSKK